MVYHHDSYAPTDDRPMTYENSPVVRTCARAAFFALPLVVIALVGSIRTPVTVAHPLAAPPRQATAIPTCPPTQFGNDARCYAARIETFATPQVMGARALLDLYIAPCVPYDWATGFSWNALWINGRRSSGDGVPSNEIPWLEFGVMVRGAPTGGICPHEREEAVYYSYCGYCYTSSNPARGEYGDNGYNWHGKPEKLDKLFMYRLENVPSLDPNRSGSVDRWVWTLNGQVIRKAEDSNVGRGDAVRIGSETTHWDIDTGRSVFSKVWNTGANTGLFGSLVVSTKSWQPNNQTYALGFEDGDHNGHRYWSYYRKRGQSHVYNVGRRRGAMTWVNSDDAEPGLTTRCDYSQCKTPTPVPPTATPTP